MRSFDLPAVFFAGVELMARSEHQLGRQLPSLLVVCKGQDRPNRKEQGSGVACLCHVGQP